LQVMSHMLKDYRGKIDLIYIDPPFDSKADYKKKIKLKGQEVTNDSNSFEEKQYGDIWTNDEYLQFMYERLILLRELLSDKGSIYVHCDWHQSHHLRMIMDEIFGPSNFINDIIWKYSTSGSYKSYYARNSDNILFYSKNMGSYYFEQEYIFDEFDYFKKVSQGAKIVENNGEKFYLYNGENRTFKKQMTQVWIDIDKIKRDGLEIIGYPTQKPEDLLKRIIKMSSKPGDIVFDCFMGSGTTLKVANDLNRKFIGADINLGSVQITTKRLNGDFKMNKNGFEVYNVNNYDIFRNPIEAKKLIIEALELQSLDNRSVFDGEKDGRFYKILSINRIASKADLSGLIGNLPYKAYDQRSKENPNEPVEKITLVTMGHEPDLKGTLEKELSKYKIDIEIIDLLRSESKLEFKRDSVADIIVNKDYLEIKNFYPMNLLQKLSLESAEIDNWKQLVESIMVDFNFDGNVLNPTVTDIPEKNKYVVGKYKIPAGTKKIKIKITDLLSESFEKEIEL
jgi:site-specific DNA-methyltransferase (adenine-specific)